jgi:hypothetical protein
MAGMVGMDACVVLFAFTVMFLVKSPHILNMSEDLEASEALTVLLRAMALTYPTVGAFIVSRRPSNTIGWILCGTGLLTSVRAFAIAYTQYGVAGRPGSLPGQLPVTRQDHLTEATAEEREALCRW